MAARAAGVVAAPWPRQPRPVGTLGVLTRGGGGEEASS